MKILVRENQFDKVLYDYLDKFFEPENLNYIPYIDVEDNVHDAYAFYYGDYLDDDTVFRYYGNNYFVEPNDKTPFIEIEYKYERMLNNILGNMWKPIFKQWFEDKYFPVKNII
jgi:hypothetical protein